MKLLWVFVLSALLAPPAVAQLEDVVSDAFVQATTSMGIESGSNVRRHVGSPAVPVARPVANGRLWFEPRVGWMVPTRDLGRTDIIDNLGFGVFDRADPTATLGLGAGFDLGSGFAVRASADWALGTSVHGQWLCAPFVACPSVLLPLEGQLSAWFAAADALFTLPLGYGLRPVVFAGIGVRSSDLEWGEPAADITLPAFSFDETEPIYRLGAGIVYSLGAAAEVFGQADVTATRFGGGSYNSIEGSIAADRKLSFDVGFLTGVRVRLPWVGV